MFDRAASFLSVIIRLPQRGLLGLIWLYQKIVSPVLPAVFGPACGCRFTPTCSHYAAEALKAHGVWMGSWLAIRRLAKCTPLHPGGEDPVPASLKLRRTRSSRNTQSFQNTLSSKRLPVCRSASRVSSS